MIRKTKPIKPWIKYLIYLMDVLLLVAIFYLSSKFYCQTKKTQNIKLLSNQLIDTILPLSNLLSKSTGNIRYNKHDNKTYIQPSVLYQQHNKTHKLEIILSNPSYSLMDCTGNVTEKTTYPLRISFIWQPMLNIANEYELICERHNNFKNLNKNKNIERKILLQHINEVKFKVLVPNTPNNNDDVVGTFDQEIKYIDPLELQHDHNQQIKGVQIGMLLKADMPAYQQKQYTSYHVFRHRLNFLDQFSRKVIYITIPGELA